MTRTEYSGCILELMKQHEELKVTSALALDLLQTWAEDGDSKHLEKLRQQILGFCQLCLDHFKHEEEILVPLFKEMYETNEQISEYVRHEHENLNHQFSVLAKLIRETTEPTTELVEFVSSILYRQLEHKFMEEQALFPLVQHHIDKTKH